MTDKTQHDDTTRLAIIETKVDAVVTAFAKLEQTLSTSTTVHVTRAEWELRNTIVDERFTTVLKNITSMQEDEKAKRAPWWSAAAVVIAGAAFLWAVFGPHINAVPV